METKAWNQRLEERQIIFDLCNEEHHPKVSKRLQLQKIDSEIAVGTGDNSDCAPRTELGEPNAVNRGAEKERFLVAADEAVRLGDYLVLFRILWSDVHQVQEATSENQGALETVNTNVMRVNNGSEISKVLGFEVALECVERIVVTVDDVAWKCFPAREARCDKKLDFCFLMSKIAFEVLFVYYLKEFFKFASFGLVNYEEI